jgi:hypothetical protein
MSFDSETPSASIMKNHLEPLFDKLSAQGSIRLAMEMQHRHQQELEVFVDAKIEKIKALYPLNLDKAAYAAAKQKLDDEYRAARNAALDRHKAESVQLNVDVSMSGHMLDLCSLNVSLIHSFRAYQEARAKEIEAEGNKAAAAHAQ